MTPEVPLFQSVTPDLLPPVGPLSARSMYL